MDETKLLEAMALRRKFAYELFKTLRHEGDSLLSVDIAQMALQGVHPIFELVELMQAHGLTEANAQVASDFLFSRVEDQRINGELQAIMMKAEYKPTDVAYAMLVGFISTTLALALTGTEKIGGENETDK